MRVVVASCIAALSLAGALPAAAAPDKEKLMKPESLNQKAPDAFRVKFETSRGDFVLDVTRAWAPNGADRFYNLVKHGYYEECRFFRVLSGFVVQWGINGDPALNRVWRNATIQDDPVMESNKRGYVTYAMGGPNSRTTQLFINLADNLRLDEMGFSPFARVSEGMEVVESLYAGYGEGSPRGMGPEQGRIQMEGNKYLGEQFPRMDWIKKATILP
jgi:peptidyl-prolyl cis-trans isomerase A (cyclophilin A)